MGKLKMAAAGLGPRAGLPETAAGHPDAQIVGLCDVSVEAGTEYPTWKGNISTASGKSCTAMWPGAPISATPPGGRRWSPSATAFSTLSHVRPDLPSGADLQMAVFETACGAVYKQLCGFSVMRHPALHYYMVYGSKMTLETDREDMSTLVSFTDVPNLGGLSRLPLSYASTKPGPAWANSGHGGADGMMIVDFLDSLLGGSVLPIDVFRGLDFSLPGISAVESIRNGNRKVPVPDLRDW